MVSSDHERLLGQPKEVHSRYQDGLWWFEEGQGQKRLDHLLDGGYKINLYIKQCMANPPACDPVI